MRFLDFPDWLGVIASAVDTSDASVWLISFTVLHLLLFVSGFKQKMRLHHAYNFILWLLLLELPLAVTFLLYLAGLPKA